MPKIKKRTYIIKQQRMITVIKGQLNNIYLTLKDNGFNYSAYTFSCFDLMEKKTTNITITDIASPESKYSQFQITDPTDLNLNPGSFEYTVFYGDQKCESGLLRVSGVTGTTTVSMPAFKNKTEYATFRKQ